MFLYVYYVGSESSNEAAVIGGAVGGTVLLLLLVALCVIVLCVIHSYKRQKGSHSTYDPHFSPSRRRTNNDYNPHFSPSRRNTNNAYELKEMEIANVPAVPLVQARVCKCIYIHTYTHTYLLYKAEKPSVRLSVCLHFCSQGNLGCLCVDQLGTWFFR